MEEQSGAVFHSLFRLRDSVAEREFLAACEAFYRHLIEAGFARSYRIMRRQLLEGFGDTLPRFEYHGELEFADLDHDRRCDEYVRRNEEPVRSLHRAMNSKVGRGSADFFLRVCVAEGG